MRILYFGDGPWATKGLERIIQQGQEVLGVVLRREPSDTSVSDAAMRFGIREMQPKNVNSAEFVATVAKMGPDLCVSMSYDQILRRPIMDVPELGFINFHTGNLPYFRGRNVINWAIINNEPSIGLTAHYVDEGIDTGDIILQRTVPIRWEDTYGDVLGRVIDAFPDLMLDTLALIEQGRAPRESQTQMNGTYFCARRDGDEWIDWSDTSLDIYNKIRAITRPAPGARTLLDDRVLTIWSSRYDLSWPNYIATPGEVVGTVAGEGSIVKTGDSTLLIKNVQLEGEEERRANFPIATRFGLNLHQEVYRLKKTIAQLTARADG